MKKTSGGDLIIFPPNIFLYISLLKVMQMSSVCKLLYIFCISSLQFTVFLSVKLPWILLVIVVGTWEGG